MNIIQSNLSFRSNMEYGNKPDTIVLHHAEASHCSVYDIDQWHKQRGWAGIGYHYFVTKAGQVYTGRPENVVGAHCPGENDHSIGICAEGEYMSETMPEIQKNAIIELCKYIKGKYNIKTIGGHKEFYSTDCPGTNYPLQEIKDLIVSASKEDTPTQSVSVPKYDEFIPTGPNIMPILGCFYIEKRTDGDMGIHLDRGNYITIRKGGAPMVTWNNNKGQGGQKKLF
ncbi:peptidoglycan recognition protein family protein [Clostridium coskatii]|uniref:N-acetylmuramoyl-L-alanine amidase n=1 Tax=Clostridium coskatii TaxID=1705578 RepID=A0A166RD50_9CLOT|nr:peptidoglycan recognition family protein [Clostridium coskatii]OAA90698.1 N-acetylmuramoyl-L-alanine amidase [Clostridium coskatii]OBR97466.1 N-acetylmuramoyl-L-alanine amidase [Clostridium coskatii]